MRSVRCCWVQCGRVQWCGVGVRCLRGSGEGGLFVGGARGVRRSFDPVGLTSVFIVDLPLYFFMNSPN